MPQIIGKKIRISIRRYIIWSTGGTVYSGNWTRLVSLPEVIFSIFATPFVLVGLPFILIQKWLNKQS